MTEPPKPEDFARERVTYAAVNMVDKYCNAHVAAWRTEAENLGLTPIKNYGAVAPKNLTGPDRLGITKAALLGLAWWLRGQNAATVVSQHQKQIPMTVEAGEALDAIADHIERVIGDSKNDLFE